MPIVRWLSGMFKVLAGMWSTQEWMYYARSGVDPRLPAFRRWTVRLKDEAKPPETRAEELMPLRNYKVILSDEYHLAPEDMVFHTTHLDKAQAVLAQYQRELQSRSSGDFYYRMIKNRQLDFFHNFSAVGSEIREGSAEIDEEQEREKFLR